MSNLSARLNLPLIAPSQAQKHVTHNEALTQLEVLVQTSVVALNATTPPASPEDGVLYGIGAAPSGDWAGQSGMLAMRVDNGWFFTEPEAGWRAWDQETAGLYVYDGQDWVSAQSDLEALDGLGINASWDTTNRLSVASDAVLLSHDGSDHRLKVNKAADADTASLLFQSGFTGHAEMGLAGNTAFSIKVSGDGSTWTDALQIDPNTGILSGAALQAAADDTTPGRLMRADWGYGPGNVIGTVSEAAGVPTGAVVERGEGPDGSYVRWADGTQMCWVRADLVYDSAVRLEYEWTFPAPFSSVGYPSISANLENEFGAAPGPTQLHGPFARQGGSPSATTCSLRIYRSETAPDFDVSDTLSVQATAIGRWF